MIWFNGFPFLDNKEEHVFNVPVSRVMTGSSLSLPAFDLPVREAEHLLNDNKFQGFPIVEDRASKILVGYIGRTELRYAINKARRVQPLSPNAKCIFTHETVSSTSRIHSPAPRTPGPYLDAPQTFDELETTTGSKAVDFTPYVDHTPISVHPRLPLETVMELFKKMGPRVILVEQRGKLMGLVTVKDCLKYQFKVEAQENATTANGPAATGTSGHGENDGAVATLEEKVWSFLQKVGQTLQLIRTRSIRLDGSARSRHGRNERPAENTDEHEYGILEGTEEDGPVELEDRVR
jgi:chloride channel 3/4/5